MYVVASNPSRLEIRLSRGLDSWLCTWQLVWLTRITRIVVNPQKEEIIIWIFTHVGLSVHAHNIVQEVEVHGWLLSGIEELTILCCSFLTLVANK